MMKAMGLVKILLLVISLFGFAMTSEARTGIIVADYGIQLPDSNVVPKIPVAEKDSGEVEDNPFLIKGGKKREPVDSAKMKGQMDPRIYILDKRYIAKGDSTLPWYRNMFLQLGAGFEQMVPPASDYQFDALTSFHLGLGLQLNKYNSLRLMAHGALGYQKRYDRMFAKGGLRLDHLYDWTSYFDGYRSDRLMGVSTIVGLGVQRSALNRMGRRGNSIEGHGGLQLRFYTGPHGVLNIEPYIGVATDNMDLSDNRNWRRYDIFYGANLNYVYYFSNHLSRATRMRLEKANRDSVLLKWQAPWFFEFSSGPNLLGESDLKSSDTMGHNITLSVGKWFSPVIGVKASAMFRTLTWRKETSHALTTDYVTRYNTQYYSGRLEAMLNPLGFSKNFHWDAPAGFYLLAGGEYGWFIKEQSGRSLHCRSEAYTAGLHLWARLATGVSVFIEPRFMHNVYKIPYNNVLWNQRFSDNTYGVNIGLTASTIKPEKKTETPSDIKKIVLGAGGGINLMQETSYLEGEKHFPMNAHLFAEYRFNHVSGIRLGFDFLLKQSSSMTSFYDYNMSAPEAGYAPIMRNGLWNHSYRIGFLALDYSINLGNALSGYKGNSIFQLEAFAGPALMVLFGEGGSLDGRELLMSGHEARVATKVDGVMRLAVNAGTKLSAQITPHIALTLTPQLHYVPNMKVVSIGNTRRTFFESLDFGIQYGF